MNYNLVRHEEYEFKQLSGAIIEIFVKANPSCERNGVKIPEQGALDQRQTPAKARKKAKT